VDYFWVEEAVEAEISLEEADLLKEESLIFMALTSLIQVIALF